MASIAVYSRVSTDDQDHAAQESVVTQWLSTSGLDLSQVEWYRDTESGDTMGRKAMARLQKDVFAGKVKTVVCYKLDRLSRNMLDGLTFVAQACDKGCRVVSVTQAIDLSGTMGRIIAAVLFGFAEIEQQTRRERQRAGIDVARKQGVYTGRKAGSVVADPQRARDLRSKGLTLPEIASALSVTPRTVSRYLGAVTIP